MRFRYLIKISYKNNESQDIKTRINLLFFYLLSLKEYFFAVFLEHILRCCKLYHL